MQSALDSMFAIAYIASMETTETNASRILRLRNHLSLSQEELAAKLNVSFATVNRWEAGKSSPQRAQLAKIDELAAEAGLDNGVDARPLAVGSRRRRGVAQSVVLGNRGMEQMLWDAACSIRGQQDAPKFKDYILPLLFIKRLSDVFDDEVERLTQQFGDREVALEVLEDDHSLVRFYIPPEARWAVVSGREAFAWPKDKAPRTLGEQLTTTSRTIVKHNRDLAGVIDLVDYSETRNGEREISDAALKRIIEKFSDPRYRLGLQDVEPDFLGRCYEYLLRKFAEGQGQSAGEFFTPTEVGFLMAEIMRPRPGEEAYDFACGSFGLLIKLQLISRRLDPTSKVPLKLYGQEFVGETYGIACMNRIIHDMEGEVYRGDSMVNPKVKDEAGKLRKFDIVVANPMWNQPIDPELYEKDAYERFLQHGGITGGKADWAWLQHAVTALKGNGRAAIVLDTGAVTRGSGSKNEDKERNIRRWFVEHDLIDGVILLPDNLFYNTPAAGIILILSNRKSKDRKGKIVLINAGREFKKGTPKNFLTDESISKIATTFLAARTVEGFSAVISTEQARNKDYILSPASYVTPSSNSAPSRDVEHIVRDLDAIEKKRARVDAEVRRMLRQLRPSADKTPWAIATIGDLFDIGAGKTVSPASRHGEPKHPFLRTANVFWGRLDLTEVDRMHFTSEEVEAKTLNKGDLLVCEGGEIGRAAIWDGQIERCGFQNHLHRLRRKSADVVPAFFMYALQAGFTLHAQYEGAGNKTTIPNLSRSRLAALEVPKPEHDEQLRIVAVLAKVQAAIEVEEELIGVSRDAGALNELFTSLLDKLLRGELRADHVELDELAKA
jgi:type I restriction enzyme M protein